MTLPQRNKKSIDQICIIYRTEEKIKRVASGCKGSSCQYKNLKYLQVSLLPRLPIMSIKCIIYRPLKHQKRLRVTTKLSVDARMLKALTSPLRS